MVICAHVYSLCASTNAAWYRTLHHAISEVLHKAHYHVHNSLQFIYNFKKR